MADTPIIYLAPFQGITGVTFRSVYARHFGGVDKLFTPFFTGINTDSKLPARKLAQLGGTHENGIEVIPQILSKDADEIIRFAHICENLGFSEINWNLGCPYPMVAKKKRGSGMLPYPEMVAEILERVMPALKIRFSVKCRLGYLSEQEIFELIPVFNGFTISDLTIHARIGKQLYKGVPDMETFRKAEKLITLPLVYNGDIFSVESYRLFAENFSGINTWMIGRGLLSDPFLPADIKGMHTTDHRKEYIRIFIGDLYIAYRRQMNDNIALIGVLKEYWNYLSKSFDDPHKVFKKLKKVKSFDEYENAVDFIFNEYQWVGSGYHQPDFDSSK